jgi:hypothetical protein
MYMLLLPRIDGRIHAYVGQTTAPRRRLLQHRRRPPYDVANALRADRYTVDNLLYVPLEVVPAEHSTDFETRWTLLASGQGRRTLNSFGAVGDPSRSRRFWARLNALRWVRPAAVSSSQDVVDLT